MIKHEPQIMTRRQMAACLRRIDAEKKKIAKSRDALRDILADLEIVRDSSDEGVRLLEAAVDELSADL